MGCQEPKGPRVDSVMVPCRGGGVRQVFLESALLAHYTRRRMLQIRKLLRKIPVFPFEGPSKVAYNAFLILSALAGTIITSYRLTFKLYDFDAIYWIITIVYLLDIPYTFNQSVKKGLTISSDRRSIARMYLRGWFAVDLLASIPFTWIFFVTSLWNPSASMGVGAVLDIIMV